MIKGLENEEIHGIFWGDSGSYLCIIPVLNYSRSVYAAGLAAIKCIMEDNKPLHRLSIEILVAVQECQNFP